MSYNLRQGVRDSQVFLLLLSARVLGSWFCRQELLCAIAAGKRIQLVLEADPRFPDARAAAALIEKLNTLLPAIDLPQEPLLAEAEMLEAQLQALMESAGGATKPSPSSNAMLYG